MKSSTRSKLQHALIGALLGVLIFTPLAVLVSPIAELWIRALNGAGAGVLIGALNGWSWRLR